MKQDIYVNIYIYKYAYISCNTTHNTYLERPLEKVLKKGEYIAIKSHHTPGDNNSGSYEIKIPYYGGGSPEEWLVW